LIKIALSVL